MSTPRVLIFANGHLPNPAAARSLLRPDDYLIGADGGTGHILSLDRTPDMIVGDMDSLDEALLARLERQGVKVHRHPRDKNETDLELALAAALERQPESILIVAALGARLDQTLGNLALAADPSLAALDLRLDDGVEQALFCRDQAEVRGEAGEVVSLIPWNGPAVGVTTMGLKWPLHDETLELHKTRGISNELEGEQAVVQVREGLLLVVHRRGRPAR